VQLKNKREHVVGQLLLTLILLVTLLHLLLGRCTKSVMHELVSHVNHLLQSHLLGTHLLRRHLLRLILQHPQ
jgi:hypothetical protein